MGREEVQLCPKKYPAAATVKRSKHNSNYKTKQTTLKEELNQEYVYCILGFVSADIVRLNNDICLVSCVMNR